MRRFWLIIAAFMLAACGVCKHSHSVALKDSIRVEYRQRIIYDTARIEVPKEVEKIVTRDTSSHLENRLAFSDAVISGGFLHHTLQTKPQTIKAPVAVPVRDTVYIERSEKTEAADIKEEKPLTWWQRFRLRAFWWLVLGICGLLLWTFRKPVLALMRL